MSQNWSSVYAPLKVEPRPSRCLRYLFPAAFAGLAACPWLTPLPPYLCLTLSAGAMLWLTVVWRRRVEFGGPPLTVTWARDGSWAWEQSGTIMPVTLRGDTLLTTGLVILNFDSPDGVRRSVMLLADNLDPDTFRRLRVRLRFEARGKEEEPRRA